jgi:hypothetical protein
MKYTPMLSYMRERPGTHTEKGDHNRLVAVHNAVLTARNERQALTMEQAADERCARRVSSGWTSDDARPARQ